MTEPVSTAESSQPQSPDELAASIAAKIAEAEVRIRLFASEEVMLVASFVSHRPRDFETREDFDETLTVQRRRLASIIKQGIDEYIAKTTTK